MSSPLLNTAFPAPSPSPLYIYKILPSSPFPPSSPSSLPSTLPLSPLDAHDSFIHLSTSSQLLGTLSKFFNEAEHVYILRVPFGRVAGRIKWERAGRKEEGREDGRREGAKEAGGRNNGREGADEVQVWSFRVRTDVFPHLYDLKLGRDEVDKIGKWERGSGSGEGWDPNGWPFEDDIPGVE